MFRRSPDMFTAISSTCSSPLKKNSIDISIKIQIKYYVGSMYLYLKYMLSIVFSVYATCCRSRREGQEY